MNDQAADKLKNGLGAAAILAAGIGALTLGVFALAGDASKPIAAGLNVWAPTGPLSGVTDVAIMAWIVTWIIFARLWRGRDVNLSLVTNTSFAMFVAAILITFPPIMDFLQGK
jgi:hypothetical protein